MTRRSLSATTATITPPLLLLLLCGGSVLLPGVSGTPYCTGTFSMRSDNSTLSPMAVFSAWDQPKLTAAGNTITSQYNARGYFGVQNSCPGSFAPQKYLQFKLLGKTLSFTMNIAQAGLGCNGAFYLSQMPTPGAGGLGDYYCDANAVGGQSCTEIDLVEANTGAIAITQHKCNTPNSGCDGAGCSINSRLTGNWFGPGTGFPINSLQSFQMSFEFVSSGNTLTDIKLLVSQGTQTVSKSFASTCSGGYLSALSTALSSGMVPIISYWGTGGGGMSWLDGSTTASCSQTGTISVSDVTIYSGSVPPPADPCAKDNGGCGPASTTLCTNSNGIATCSCQRGYTGNPPSVACTVSPVVSSTGGPIPPPACAYTATDTGSSNSWYFQYSIVATGSGVGHSIASVVAKQSLSSSSSVPLSGPQSWGNSIYIGNPQAFQLPFYLIVTEPSGVTSAIQVTAFKSGGTFTC